MNRVEKHGNTTSGCIAGKHSNIKFLCDGVNIHTIITWVWDRLLQYECKRV